MSVFRLQMGIAHMDIFQNGGDFLGFLLGAVILVIGVAAVVNGGWVLKAVGLIAALGGLELMLRGFPAIDPNVRLLAAILLFTALSATLVASKTSAGVIIGVALVIGGVFGTVSVLKGDFDIPLSDTVTEAFSAGWDNLKSIFGQAETGFDEANDR